MTAQKNANSGVRQPKPLLISSSMDSREGKQNESTSELNFRLSIQENIPFLESSNRVNDESLQKKKDMRVKNAEREILDIHGAGVILRVDREVLVHESTLGNLRYLSGSFCDLNWAALDGLTRAIGSLIPVVLSINKANVIFRSGFLLGNDRMCPAAQFSLSDEMRGIISSEQLIDTIQQCVDQLQDQRLWDYTKPGAESEVENKAWTLIDATRKARQEIPGKQLPFTCSVVSSTSKKTLKIGHELVRAKAQTTEVKDASGVGILTGYCTHERIIKFKVKGANSSTEIGFDEEKFLNDIYEFCGRNSHTVEVKWLNIFVDSVLSHRVLVGLNSLVAPIR